MPVQDTGGPLQAPVGKAILSRMFDVFGNTIDREPPLAGASQVAWRSVHRPPPPLVRRSTKAKVFETGIKAIDVLTPLERGGKAGLFGSAGVGKTVLSPAKTRVVLPPCSAPIAISASCSRISAPGSIGPARVASTKNCST
jgi:F0F1-type ATP synthase beta subunit